MYSVAAKPTPRPVLRQAIRIAMTRKRIPSVVELVRVSDVSRNTIYSWETGAHPPRIGELSKVAGALDVPMAYLIDAYEGNLWPDPQTREALPDAESVQEQVERLVRATLDRIEGERSAPGKGRVR